MMGHGRIGVGTLGCGLLAAMCGCVDSSQPPGGPPPMPPPPAVDLFDRAEPSLQPIAGGGVSGRDMRLLLDFSYVDARARRWTARARAVTNGATIPSPLWPILGSPFDADVLFAAIIHDYFCDESGRREAEWPDVHRMFYEACLKAGASPRKAKAMYAAVYHFGPRWDKAGRLLPWRARLGLAEPKAGWEKLPDEAGPAAATYGGTDPSEEARSKLEAAGRRIEAFLEESDPSLEEIEAFDPEVRE